MVSNQFETILRDLETFFNCQLRPDMRINHTCLVQLNTGIQVQIEEDPHGQLLIAVRVGTLSEGHYKDNILKAALQENNANTPSKGVLGFSRESSKLTLFITVDPQKMLPAKLNEILPPFLERAKKWSDALSRGEIPQIGESSHQPNIFGMR